jgi:purine-binding chemotaxis protein CheW
MARSQRGGDVRGALRAAPGREEFLAFVLGGERYALPVHRVREILKVPAVTEVPRAGDDLVGIVSVRGQVVAVRDLRRILRLPARPPTRRARILVVDHGPEPLGLLVDEVAAVVRLLPAQIESAPSVVRGLDAEAVAGVARPGDDLLILLGLDAVLGGGEEE